MCTSSSNSSLSMDPGEPSAPHHPGDLHPPGEGDHGQPLPHLQRRVPRDRLPVCIIIIVVIIIIICCPAQALYLLLSLSLSLQECCAAQALYRPLHWLHSPAQQDRHLSEAVVSDMSKKNDDSLIIIIIITVRSSGKLSHVIVNNSQ